MSNPEREKCQGPGHKDIYATKAEAQAELRRRRVGRIARIGQGMKYRCSWGDHYHVTSKKRPGRGGK